MSEVAAERRDAGVQFLLGVLRAVEVSSGADICDRCGGTIWPELELVRCDFCVGVHGAPEEGRVQAAAEQHKERIRQYEREERDSYLEA